MNLDFELLKTKNVLIATPMLTGSSNYNYINSMINLFYVVGKHNLNFGQIATLNSTVLTQTRNNLVDIFLKNNYDYLIFIDSDIGFDTDDLLSMVEIAIKDNEKKVIGASYSYKKINWDQVKLANDKNLIKSGQDYLKYSDLNIVTINDKIKNINVPIKVPRLPCGFILIKKEIFNKFVVNYPEQTYTDSESNQLKTVFFDFKIQKDSKLISYVGEDYMFCKYVEGMGEGIWLLPWIKLTHVGQYTYGSNNFNNLEFLEKEY